MQNPDIDNDVRDLEHMPQKDSGERPPKKHLIRITWLRRALKTFMWIIIALLLIPVLLYIPPVQTFVKNMACEVVYKSTGMKIEIGRFRLKFPVDVSLEKVTVLDEHADTMVRAQRVIADVKLLPLFALDVKLKRLRLENGYYRMVAADSSMILKLNAGLLDVDDKSSANIAASEINLNKALLRDGSVAIFMDQYKKKEVPQDTTSSSTPFLIKANDLRLENFSFAMSMLPTIDTLHLNARDITLQKGVIDLRKNLVTWKLASVSSGSGEYITPTAEWVKNHPLPPSPPSSGPPIRIQGDSISLDDFAFTYATKGASPQPGFDAAYMRFSEIGAGIRNFYNEATALRLPIMRLQAKERSGLRVVRGSGAVNVDSTGLALNNLDIATVYSYIKGSADVPFALMELKPEAPVNVNMKARIGMPDVDAFMPQLREYTLLLPARNPLDLNIDAEGTLSSVDINRLDVELRDALSLRASGYADNPLDIKRMEAEVDFDGILSDPRAIDKFTGKSGINIPAFRLQGTASAMRDSYAADFTFTSTVGNAEGRGHVGMNSEKYSLSAGVEHLDVGSFMPSLGIGHVTATIDADGAGFNPLNGRSITDATIHVSSIEYNKRLLKDIKADIILSPDHNFDIYAISANDGLNFELEGKGIILSDDYTFDIAAHIRDLDLCKLGMSKDMNSGKGSIYLTGTASPEKWLYNATLKLNDFDWNLPNQYIHLPGGLTADIDATEFSTKASVDSYLTSMNFESSSGLKNITDAFAKASEVVMKQVKEKNISMDTISMVLPPFSLSLNASGKGLLNQFLVPSGMSLDTVYGTLSKDSLFHGNIAARRFASSAIDIDTLTLALKERNSLLDYKLHIGNRPGTMDEFASVNLNGYLGANRLGAFLVQRNLAGKTGYRLGMTASLRDSIASVHFTPLNATIAYLPWSLNDDNYVDYNVYNMRVDANLTASSAESSILLRTEPTQNGLDELHMKLDNIRIEDFLRMSVTAPPVKGSVNSDIHVQYDGQMLCGKGTLGVRQLVYDRNRLGDFNLEFDADLAHDGSTNLVASMMVNDKPAISAYANLRKDSVGGMSPDSIGLSLTQFPLNIANPFLDNTATLAGTVNGSMRMDGSFSKPLLNGDISFSDASVYVPMVGCKLTFDTVPVTVRNSVVNFDKFDFTAANKNPLTIDGTVNAESFGNILLDLGMSAHNTQLINSNSRSKADLYGKLFVNLDGSVKGSLNLMDVRANLNVLGTTDITYRLNMEPATITGTSDQKVVKFINFNDTTSVVKADSVTNGSSMRIRAGVTISPGTKAVVLLSTNGTDKVQLTPSANLNYFQNYMGDMRLTGTLTLGNGFARYNVPVIGDKMFTFNPSSQIIWSGDLMNPKLNITASDDMKANMTQNGNSRLVNFLVTLKATGTLNSPKVNFDLSTNDDMSIQNELQSMSADQRQTQAMNLLLYGQYTGQNAKANANLSGNMLYGFLESQLNSWAAKNIRGVDLSFGIDQYDKTRDGSSSTQTSYSYQVSKALFNNRFKIQVGGNYSTDASADENLSQNLISDISAEYILKQTETLNMSVRLFRHTGFESILEGEVTETGAGFVMKRKLDNLFKLFRFRRPRRRTETDTVKGAGHSAVKAEDSITEPKKGGEK